MKEKYIVDAIETPIGKIPKVSSILSSFDTWSNLKIRMAVSRMDYIIVPGVYAVGNPIQSSKVLVSANYKLSFDALRKELKGLDAWILVIDTKGINVWCAAGKGTFGTDELVSRIEQTNLKNLVDHRKLIVPQLGAPGVSAHEVKKQSGFSVIYGPVRASDLLDFISHGMKANNEMRQVNFTLIDRLKLVPVEFVVAGRSLIFIMAVFFLFSGVSKNGFSIDLAGSVGLLSSVNLVFAFIAGTVLGPVVLPWLPGNYFFVKGFFAGILLFVISLTFNLMGSNLLDIIAWFLLILAISSYLTMNFTGASTYTSLSGVRKEMKIAIPMQIIATISGCLIWITGRFIMIGGVL